MKNLRDNSLYTGKNRGKTTLIHLAHTNNNDQYALATNTPTSSDTPLRPSSCSIDINVYSIVKSYNKNNTSNVALIKNSSSSSNT